MQSPVFMTAAVASAAGAIVAVAVFETGIPDGFKLCVLPAPANHCT